MSMLENRTLIQSRSRIFMILRRNREGSQLVQTDPAYKRETIESLDIRSVFAIVNGQKEVYNQYVLVANPNDWVYRI